MATQTATLPVWEITLEPVFTVRIPAAKREEAWDPAIDQLRASLSAASEAEDLAEEHRETLRSVSRRITVIGAVAAD